MDQTLLTSLPTDIITNILSRLPIRTIVSCQCVCKSWCELVKTPEFVDFHLSKSDSGLIIFEHASLPQLFRIFEFEDELKIDQHELHYVPVAKFRISFLSNHVSMEGSTNGLLLLRDARLESLYICNPITSEYINIPSQEGNIGFPSLTTYGLGVSKMTNQYKVVGISQKREKNPNTKNIPSSECHVYTLGTRSWRLVPQDSSLRYRDHSDITFLKGNLHWLVSDLKESDLISCFDLETEVFKAFSPPPPYLMERGSCLGVLAALGDRLCLCDNIDSENEVVIWVMKEYGVEKSWTRDYVIRSKFPDFNYFDDDLVYPIKVFKDGVILVLWRFAEIFYYCNKTKTTLGVDLFEKQDLTWFEARLHVSSFISLKRFAMENVVKF